MSVICIDSTHGTNSYDFLLTTVMVLDSNRQGFPAVFILDDFLMSLWALGAIHLWRPYGGGSDGRMWTGGGR